MWFVVAMLSTLAVAQEETSLSDALEVDHALTRGEFERLFQALEGSPTQHPTSETDRPVDLNNFVFMPEAPSPIVDRVTLPFVPLGPDGASELALRRTRADWRAYLDRVRKRDENLYDDREIGVRCGLGAGLAGAVSPAGRDWDLSTPGPVALSWSPVLSHQCFAADIGLTTMPWASLDVVPGLRHSYAGLGVRSPLIATASVGTGFWLGAYERLGPMLVTNGLATGAGLRFEVTDERGPYGLEARLFGMLGADPAVHLWVIGRFSRRVMGRDPGLDRLARRKGHAVDPYTRVEWGMEGGTLIGVRAQLSLGDREPDVGLRLGILSDLLADDVLQPTLLAVADLPIVGPWELTTSAGATLRDAHIRPTASVGASFDPVSSPFEVHAGPRVVHDGERTLVGMDVGVALVWGRHLRSRHGPAGGEPVHIE